MAISVDDLKKRLESDANSPSGNEAFILRMAEALEKIIDGNLLLLNEIPDYDNPYKIRQQVYIDIDFSGLAPVFCTKKEEKAILKNIDMALKAVEKKYPSWKIKISYDDGFSIIFCYRPNLQKRRKNITERFKRSGHNLAPWKNNRTKCLNPGCQLSFHLQGGSRPGAVDHLDVFVNQWPVQYDPTPCPWTKERERQRKLSDR